MGFVSNAVHREPWNKGKIVGQKAPCELKDIWALRVRFRRTTEFANLHCSTWVSVSLQAVTSALSWCYRPPKLNASFSGRTAQASAHTTRGARGGYADWFVPFNWHNLAFDPFNLSPSAQLNTACRDGSPPRES